MIGVLPTKIGDFCLLAQREKVSQEEKLAGGTDAKYKFVKSAV
jgi:hypothetical protein